MDSLKDQVDIPVSFFLDAVPFYDLKELPFETVMEWGDYRILRDRNVHPGEVFDPLLLMPIPKGRYEIVYHALVTCNQMDRFVMPICRCRRTASGACTTEPRRS